MLFNAKFNNPINETDRNYTDIEVEYNSIVGKDIIYFKNHEFEIERDENSLISEITFCNQCVQTFDIEEVFIDLIGYLLKNDETVILIDSNGSEEE
ncbi:MAG: hypothetical protein GY936_02810, partial [Ignavibacteriae bacterium]|nr:hypothetical protein [Ignavibacteriota bacterium]